MNLNPAVDGGNGPLVQGLRGAIPDAQTRAIESMNAFAKGPLSVVFGQAESLYQKEDIEQIGTYVDRWLLGSQQWLDNSSADIVESMLSNSGLLTDKIKSGLVSFREEIDNGNPFPISKLTEVLPHIREKRFLLKAVATSLQSKVSRGVNSDIKDKAEIESYIEGAYEIDQLYEVPLYREALDRVLTDIFGRNLSFIGDKKSFVKNLFTKDTQNSDSEENNVKNEKDNFFQYDKQKFQTLERWNQIFSPIPHSESEIDSTGVYANILKNQSLQKSVKEYLGIDRSKSFEPFHLRMLQDRIANSLALYPPCIAPWRLIASDVFTVEQTGVVKEEDTLDIRANAVHNHGSNLFLYKAEEDKKLGKESIFDNVNGERLALISSTLESILMTTQVFTIKGTQNPVRVDFIGNRVHGIRENGPSDKREALAIVMEDKDGKKRMISLSLEKLYELKDLLTIEYQSRKKGEPASGQRYMDAVKELFQLKEDTNSPTGYSLPEGVTEKQIFNDTELESAKFGNIIYYTENNPELPNSPLVSPHDSATQRAHHMAREGGFTGTSLHVIENREDMVIGSVHCNHSLIDGLPAAASVHNLYSSLLKQGYLEERENRTELQLTVDSLEVYTHQTVVEILKSVPAMYWSQINDPVMEITGDREKSPVYNLELPPQLVAQFSRSLQINALFELGMDKQLINEILNIGDLKFRDLLTNIKHYEEKSQELKASGNLSTGDMDLLIERLKKVEQFCTSEDGVYNASRSKDIMRIIKMSQNNAAILMSETMLIPAYLLGMEEYFNDKIKETEGISSQDYLIKKRDRVMRNIITFFDECMISSLFADTDIALQLRQSTVLQSSGISTKLADTRKILEGNPIEISELYQNLTQTVELKRQKLLSIINDLVVAGSTNNSFLEVLRGSADGLLRAAHKAVSSVELYSIGDHNDSVKIANEASNARKSLIQMQKDGKVSGDPIYGIQHFLKTGNYDEETRSLIAFGVMELALFGAQIPVVKDLLSQFRVNPNDIAKVTNQTIGAIQVSTPTTKTSQNLRGVPATLSTQPLGVMCQGAAITISMPPNKRVTVEYIGAYLVKLMYLFNENSAKLVK